MRSFMLLLPAFILLSGCNGEEKDTALVPEVYADWASTVDGSLKYEIPGHTMSMRKIFINQAGTRLAITDSNGQVVHEYPEGTIILKENYPTDTSTEPAQLTAMIKSKDDPRARGGWIWVAKNTGTGEEAVFSDEFCFTCHQNANEPHPYGDGNTDGEFRDFVFYPWEPDNEE